MIRLKVDTDILAHYGTRSKPRFANRLRLSSQLIKIRLVASVLAVPTRRLGNATPLSLLIDQVLYTEDWAAERNGSHMARQARRARRALERFIPDEGCRYE